MSAYYNEFKPEAAHMLRQLIRDGLIADGEVDERSITEVMADDVKGFTQCHFFAGIGGWSVALRLALWPDDRPVWTGSCPCQPFSTAGKQKGHGDERHLWPHWARLIRESKPSILFGEQVSSAIAYGWWDDVAADLEAEGYACAAAVLPACSVGKPHKRDRLWFVADAECLGRQGQGQMGESIGAAPCGDREADWPVDDSARSDVGNAEQQRLEGKPVKKMGNTGIVTQTSEYAWLTCPDGKQRPVEPSICLLAHGVQHRAPLLHGYGNAIVPQVAAEFIGAML